MSNNKKIPMRKCVGCQEMKSKKEMMRVLKTSEDTFELDATGKNKGLERSFKQAIPKEVYEKLEKEMNALEIE